MEPYVTVDRYGLPTVVSNMNFGMNGFQQWNETGYPHCKLSAIGQEIPKRTDRVQEIQDYSNVIELTLKTKRSRTVFGFEGTLFFFLVKKGTLCTRSSESQKDEFA